jgi:hypothetical protein
LKHDGFGLPGGPRAQEHFCEIEACLTLLEEVVGCVGQRDCLPREPRRSSGVPGSGAPARFDP